MGAGSSVQAESSDEDFEYGQALNASTNIPLKPTKKTEQKTLAEFLASDDLIDSPVVNRKANLDELTNGVEEMTRKEEDKQESRFRGLFGFRRKEDDKNESQVNYKEEETTKNPKGFQLFKWKKENKKQGINDETIDEDIHDMQKTFDSLGIVSKENNHDYKIKEKKGTVKRHSADDIQHLEPMRNRNIPRTRSHNINGITTNTMQTSSGGSKRTFKYSWEEDQENNPVRQEEWGDFNLNKIEGFDIDKFKQSNNQESSLENSFMNNLTNAIQPEDNKSFSYDQRDKELLASIEREYFAV